MVCRANAFFQKLSGCRCLLRVLLVPVSTLAVGPCGAAPLAFPLLARGPAASSQGPSDHPGAWQLSTHFLEEAMVFLWCPGYRNSYVLWQEQCFLLGTSWHHSVGGASTHRACSFSDGCCTRGEHLVFRVEDRKGEGLVLEVTACHHRQW